MKQTIFDRKYLQNTTNETNVNMFMYKVYLTLISNVENIKNVAFITCHWLNNHVIFFVVCNTSCNGWNALRRKSLHVFYFAFFFSAHEYRNIGIIRMVIWIWYIKKHLRKILGLYGRNTKKLSACLEKRVF